MKAKYQQLSVVVSANTMLKLMVIVFIIALFGSGHQKPIRLMQQMNRNLPQFGVESEKIEKSDINALEFTSLFWLSSAKTDHNQVYIKMF